MFLMGFLGKGLRQCESGRRFASLRREVAQPKEWCKEFKEYDFIRNPVVQNEIRNPVVQNKVFSLQSKCGACGLWVLVRSLEELIEHEKLHRTQCSPSNAAD